MIEKNAEFFLTQSGKLEKNALSDEEMERIHNASESIFENEDWYRVICRSGNIIIKHILDKLGIASHLMKTTGYTNLSPTSKEKVYHWFLSVDIENTHYFLNITGDLHNIKNNFATEHFATAVDYISNEGNQLYQGEELHHTILSNEELLKIDTKIGYANSIFQSHNKNTHFVDYNNQVLAMLSSLLNHNRWYHDTIIHNLPIYKNMYTVIDGNGEKSSITSLDNRTIFVNYFDQLIKNVCLEVEKNLKKTLGINTPVLKFKNFDTWIKYMCEVLQDDLLDTYGEKYRPIIEVPENFNYKRWRSAQKGEIHCPYKHYDDYLQLLDQVSSYIQIIMEVHQAYEDGATVGNEVLKKIKNLRTLHSKIAEHFLPDNVIFEKNLEIVGRKPYIKSDYINDKFKTMFPLVFGANDKPTDFNRLGYSEQIATINKVIPYMFGEITMENCKQAPGYATFCQAALNRIRMYTLFNEETGNYELIFHIPSFFDFEDEYYYIYELTENKFYQIDIIEDFNNKKKYEVVSVTLRKKLDSMNEKNKESGPLTIEELENIERRKL